MRKKKICLSILCALILSTVAQADTITIASFADPSADSTDPLFWLDLENDMFYGGWDDSRTGLNLTFGSELGLADPVFEDAWFEMSEVGYTGGLDGGPTGDGVVTFYADGTSVDPILEIEFSSAMLSPLQFGASEIFLVGETVAITTPALEVDYTFTDESFAFGLVNQVLQYQGEDVIGFSATAAFSSSAVPEPATLVVLGLGTLALVRRKKG